MADLQRAIDDRLKNHQQPVGIGYCTSFFNKKYPATFDAAPARKQSLEAAKEEDRNAALATCGMHASVVIGRQWRYAADGKRQCMYMIQNSWGNGVASCGHYHVGRTTPSTRAGNDDQDCNGDGKIWVAADELATVVDVNFFEAP